MAETTTLDAPKPAVVEREALFSKKNRRLLSDPLNENNPITVQVLGVCSALAVTTNVTNSVVMTLSVIVVLAFANLLISLLRKGIPPRIRMIVQLTVIASLVTLVDQVLKATAYDVSRELSVYIGLIITNCIVMGRLEAFAMANTPWKSFLDGVGNALGYGLILIFVATFREIFGNGTFMGFTVIPEWLYAMGYENNGVMLSSAAAMFLIGFFIWIQRSRSPQLVDIS